LISMSPAAVSISPGIMVVLPIERKCARAHIGSPGVNEERAQRASLSLWEKE
jgi:hypothetical protein